jgi:lysophospholipase L1-like esterase
MSGNLIVNGGFENNPLSNSGWGLFETLPGWTSPTGVIEVQEGVRSAGNAVVELDSNANAVLQQTVTIATAGTYRFSLEYARNGATATNGFEVFINGISQGIITPNATGWFAFSVDVALAAGQTVIQIAARGTSDGVGTYIDNVSLAAVSGGGPTNQAPVITSNGGGATAAITINENTTAVTTVAVTDADGPTRTFSLSGVDAARFTIDQGTGALAFVTAPDFEGPTDVGADNVYNVTVTVSDGAGGSDSQALAVTVANVTEGGPPVGANLIVNGEFEVNPLNNTGWTHVDTILGWTSPLGVIEIQEGAFGAGNVEGDAIVELDASSNTTLQQIVTVGAGGTYRFSFEYAMRGNDPTTNGFEVFVNGVSVGLVTPTTAGWQTFSVDVPLSAGSHALQIAARGRSDGVGTYIDSVSFALVTPEQNDPPVLSNPLADASAAEDTAFSYTVPANAFTDPDSAILYSATLANGSPLPAWLSFNPTSRTFSGTPSTTDVGAISVRVTASDGEFSVSDDFQIAIGPTAAPALITFPPGLPGTGFTLSDLPVNSTTGGLQSNPSIAPLADGGFVATWTSEGQDGDGAGIYVRRFDDNGAPVGPETLVNVDTVGNQAFSAVTGLVGGGFVVSYVAAGDGDATGVFVRVFDAAGTPVTAPFAANSTTAGAQAGATVVSLLSGGFVVSWTSQGQDGDAGGVYTQRFSAAGAPVGGETRANATTAGDQTLASVAALTAGGYIVSWTSTGQDGSGAGVYFQRYDVNGDPVGGETRANTTTAGDQSRPGMSALANGGFVITWQSSGQDGSGTGIYGQRYDALGQPVGVEFRVNTFTSGDQTDPVVVGLYDGGFAVSWTTDLQDTDGKGISAQRFFPDGTPFGPQVRLNFNVAGDQFQDTALAGEGMALNIGGDVARVWESNGDIFIRMFNTDVAFQGRQGGNPIALPVTVAPGETGETITSVTLTGFPPGSVLSAGTPNVDGTTFTFAGPPPSNLTFTPPAGYNGAFTLTVTAVTNDRGDIETSTGSRTVTVQPPFGTPVANDDVAAGVEDMAVTIAVLTNDIDANSAPNVVAINGQAIAVNGSVDVGDAVVSLGADRRLTVTPDADFNGPLTFSYTISDGTQTDTAQVSVSFDARNDLPIVFNDSATSDEDVPVTINVLANDIDVDDSLSIARVNGVELGAGDSVDIGDAVVTLLADQSLRVTPDANFNGQVAFNYTVTDGEATGLGLVTVDFAPVNDPPVAVNDTAGTAVNTAVIVSPLANDTPGEAGGTLTITRIAGTAVVAGDVVDVGPGTVLVNLDGTLTVTPDAGFAGQINFTYEATDAGGSDEGAVSVSVAPSGVNLIVNGDFEDNPLNNAGWLITETLPGWTSPVGEIEVQESDFGFGSPAGNGIVELDSNGNATIQQIVNLAVADGYRFSFQYLMRGSDPETNGFEVFINGVSRGQVFPTEPGLQTYVLDLNLPAGQTTIQIAARGASDGTGTLVDNVSLVSLGAAVPPPPPPPPPGSEPLNFAAAPEAVVVDLASDTKADVARILLVGDSITNGFNIPGGYRAILWNELVRERGLIVDFVGERVDNPAADLRDFDHQGVNSITATQTLAGIGGVAQRTAPDLALVMIGTNDVAFEQNAVATTPGEILDILRALEAANPQIQIFLATITPRDNAAFQPQIDAINAALPSIVAQAQSEGITVSLVSMAAVTTGELVDGVHPNLSGTTDIATAWLNALLSQATQTAGTFNAAVTAIHPDVLEVTGSALNDRLSGDGRANVLRGWGGNDYIDGRGGADTLTGGTGRDTFVYDFASFGGDTITDFVSGVDQFQISRDGFGGGLVAGGTVPFVSGVAPVATSGAGTFLYNTVTGQLSWDADGNGTVTPTLIATLVGAPALSASDFVVRATPAPPPPPNQPPVITSNGGGDNAAVSVAENSTAVTTVTSTDADGPSRVFGLSGADAARFAIDQSTGALRFVTAPDFEAPTDAGGDNVYNVTVTVSDGAGGADAQYLAVTVTDVASEPPPPPPNVAPVITSNGGGANAAVTVNENTTAVTTVAVTDADGPSRTFVLSGADAARFQIDQGTGALRFVTAPDFEVPTDVGSNNVYNVTVTVNDGAGGSDAQDLAVTVADVTEGPPPPPSSNFIVNGDFEQNSLSNSGWTFADTVPGWTTPVGQLEIQESNFGNGNVDGDAIVELDSDGNATIQQVVTLPQAGQYRFSFQYIRGGTDAASNGFEVFINGVSQGLVPVAVAGWQTYTLDLALQAGANTVQIAARGISDGRGTLIDDVSLTALDGPPPPPNQPPEITSLGGGALGAVGIQENTLPVVTVTTTDPDGPGRSFTLSGADAARFSIDQSTGDLRFIAPPDFEAPTDAGGNNVYDVIVTVNDGAGGSDQQAIAVTVLDAPFEPPPSGNLFVNGEFEDNTLPNSGWTYAESVPGWTSPVGQFEIQESAFGNGNVEGDAIVELDSDANGSVEQSVTITQPGVYRFSLEYIMRGTDPTTNGFEVFINGVSVGLVSPTTAGWQTFTVDATLNPGANVFRVEARGTSDGFGTLIDGASLTALNVAQPDITSDGGDVTASVTVDENQTAVTTVVATDADGPSLIYQIVGGADQAKFALDSFSGALTFLAAPDFEAPTDVNGDNVYEVEVQATDGLFAELQFISVTVADVGELPPLIFDLNGDGVAFGAASFDFNGDGRLDRGGWLSAGDAFLALDRNGDGRISNGSEISFAADLAGADTDLEGLAAYDSNGDGVLSAADERFGSFLLWADDGDGVSEIGELYTLTQMGVVSIALSSDGRSSVDAAGNQIFGWTAVTMIDGSSVAAADTSLAFGGSVSALSLGEGSFDFGGVQAAIGSVSQTLTSALMAMDSAALQALTDGALPLEPFSLMSDAITLQQDDWFRFG